ncbi:MAG: TonB-dependent siderophore receptor [Candidatus Didemnitutus sp.]|nr:TonB-dependent siderophore receptor [Candidatus Didemnitutus sp.]
MHTHAIALSRRPAACAIVALLAATLRADDAGDTPSYLPPANEIHRLAQFEVTGQKEKNVYTVQRSVTSTKTDTALIDVPQAISVITRELIDDQAMQNIGDVTRYVPGVGIAQGEGNRDTPVLRGNSTTADFFIDGVRDDVQYFRDLYNVDRIEVLKGPNAMIFGRGGSGGLINRATKLANSRNHREATLQIGSWDQYRGTLDFGDKLSDALSYRVTGLYEDSGSYRDDVTVKRYGVNPTFRYTLSNATTLRFGYEYFHDERTADRGISSFQGRPLAVDPSTFFGNPAQSHVDASVHTAFVTVDHRFNAALTLRNHTRFSTYDKFYQNVFPGAVNATGTTVAIQGYNNATQRDNLFNQTDLVWDVDAGSLKHQILTGLELARQVTDNFRNTAYFDSVAVGTTSIQVPLSNPRTTIPAVFRQSATDADNHGVARTVGLYVQDQLELTPHLLGIVGLRYDRFEVDFDNHRTATSLASSDEMLSPRVGLVFKPAANVSLYTSYSMSFVPRAGEQLSSLSLTNRNLDPEEFKNYEVGAKWDIRPELSVTAALYRLDRTNVAITDPADSTKMLLVDGQRAKGLELGVTGRISRNWSIAGGYAYQNGEILSTQSATVKAGARLAQLPRHTLSLWNRYDLNKDWGFGLGAIYRDEIYASTDNTVRIPSFVRFDAAAFYRINDRIRAQLNVENLLDRDYISTANSNTNITPGSPRAIRLSVTTNF